jgi:hypothetical protein
MAISWWVGNVVLVSRLQFCSCLRSGNKLHSTINHALHFFIWCFSAAPRHWSNLCLGSWIAWLLSMPCFLVSKGHSSLSLALWTIAPLRFSLSTFCCSSSRLLHFQILQSSRSVIKNPYANCQLCLHLRTRSRLSLFLSGKSGTPSDTIPMPAEAIKLQIRYMSGCHYPFRQKLSSCKSGTPSDTQLPVPVKASEHVQGKFKHLISFVIY